MASAREKSIRHGHPSTLHLWWARRPLAACRAVIFTSLVDDPDDPNAPPEFVEACRKLRKGANASAQDTPRQRLFDFIETLVQWESTTDEEVLETARELIRLSTDGNPPPLLDPFAGGGSIPLEAQRLGLEAHASDLNPVAVMINKALIEIPPRFAGKPPVNPRDREKFGGGEGWRGAHGLAADVRYYGEWMRAAYPIHPELFDRLYQDWSTLDRFQRTRGVLRLMAAVIHELWSRGDQSLLILPGTLPLDAASVRNELLRYLPETWSGVTDADIDGTESRPFQIDNNVPTLGKYTACRRVARSIFIGSAPSVAAQTVRGVEEVRIRLATVQPGEPVPVFGDALKRMSNQLTYLYTDGSRYWYDTRPTVNRLARDRAQNISPDVVNQDIVARLKKISRTRDFDGAHVAPLQTSDVIDEPQVRVVVLHPDHSHKRTNGGSEALRFAQRLLEERGNSPRLYRNMLVFIAADQGDAEALREAVREHLAWLSIRDDEEQLNLDAQQRKQVQAQLARTLETVEHRLTETYSWLLMPYQPEPIGDIEWQTARISGDESFYLRAARKLHQSEALIPAWSPDNLRMELDRFNLWGEHGYIGLRQLWEYFARYCYLPRLLDDSVLQNAVRDGINRLDAPFAYATQVKNGRFNGLAFRSASSIYFDDESVLVHPNVAQQQIDADRAATEVAKPVTELREGEQAAVVRPPRTRTEPEPDTHKPPTLTRYYGTVTIDAQRVNREIGLVVEEVIQRLTSLTGCEVEIHLEISAHRAEGFDEATVRTIGENSRTLRFSGHGFEAE